MTGAAEGGRARKAPTRAAKKTPTRLAKKAPTSAAKKTPTRAAKKAPTSAAKKTGEKAISQGKTPRSTAAGSNASTHALFGKVRALCLALPNTKLTMTWGSPHFRVGEKIFCGFGVEDGKPVLGVKLELSHARSRVKDERFWPSPYVGKHGWVSTDITLRKSWDEVESLIRESYTLIAPKALLKKLR